MNGDNTPHSPTSIEETTYINIVGLPYYLDDEGDIYYLNGDGDRIYTFTMTMTDEHIEKWNNGYLPFDALFDRTIYGHLNNAEGYSFLSFSNETSNNNIVVIELSTRADPSYFETHDMKEIIFNTVCLPASTEEDNSQHFLLFGKSGIGKSTLIKALKKIGMIGIFHEMNTIEEVRNSSHSFYKTIVLYDKNDITNANFQFFRNNPFFMDNVIYFEVDRNKTTTFEI